MSAMSDVAAAAMVLGITITLAGMNIRFGLDRIAKAIETHASDEAGEAAAGRKGKE
jgi:hypothetical protein